MKENEDYIKDITAMRTMMERSSKFMSLSGLACIMVGVYALTGASIAYYFFDFNPVQLVEDGMQDGILPAAYLKIIFLAIVILVLGISTATFLSYKKANKSGERSWNPTVRRLLINMAVPLIAGGLFTLILIAQGLIGLAAPITLLFYGLALFNASKFTYEELRSLGLIQIVLGLSGSWFVEYGFLLWALGFGVVHIVYGIYLHFRYER